jgi:hypothetical protein
MVEVM